MFVAQAPKLKCQNSQLCIHSCACLIGQLLQIVEIGELSLKMCQALAQDRLPFFQLKIVKERYASEKLCVTRSVFRAKIAQISVQ
jgi:hypothetical protein